VVVVCACLFLNHTPALSPHKILTLLSPPTPSHQTALTSQVHAAVDGLKANLENPMIEKKN